MNHSPRPPPRPLATTPLAVALSALLLLLLAAGCDDDPDIPTGEPPPPDAERLDAEMDAGTGAQPPTWHTHIRPLVESRCAGCHDPGAVSGYDLSDTRWRAGQPPVWAGAVVATVLEGRMPPVLPDPACRPVRGTEPLSDEEVDLFEAWRDGGYLEGRADEYIPPAPTWPVDPGPATFRVDAGAAYIPSFTGDSDRRCLPLEFDIDADAWLSGFAVQPGERAMVRRAELYVIDANHVAGVAALDDGAPGVGYPCAGGPGVPGYRPLGIWLPDEAPFILPADHGFALATGSRLVLEVQYSARALAGEVPPERTGVDLWLPDAPPGNRVEAVELLHTNLRLPADRVVTQGRDFQIGSDGTLIGAWGRMSRRGVALDMTLVRDDSDRCIVDLPRFDPDWIGSWRFDPPHWVPVAAGDVLELRCVHDNHDPAGVMRVWGRGAEDERCDGTLLVARAADAIGGRPQCGLFAPCVERCPRGPDGGPDGDCFARCHAVGEPLCTPCLLQATGACARMPCAAEFAELGACTEGCDGADLACLIERCRAPFGAVARCAETPIASGECEGPYGACGVRFQP